MKRIFVLIMAAGRGQRVGSDVPKQYLELRGKTMLRETIEAFLHITAINIRVVINPEDQVLYEQATRGLDILAPTFGADQRQESVRKGLESLKDLQPDYILIHDAARPFVTEDVIDRIIEALKFGPGAIPGIPVIDTVKSVSEGVITHTVPREPLWRAQTPQGFCFKTILGAHEKLAHQSNFTDDASLLEALDLPVQMVMGCPKNKKITVPEDFQESLR